MKVSWYRDSESKQAEKSILKKRWPGVRYKNLSKMRKSSIQ